MHLNIIFPLSLLAASFMAQAAQTPPEYDPDSLRDDWILRLHRHSKPPLGNLTACLEGPTCSMSTGDARTYIDGLLKFEGCSSSAQSAFEASSTAGGQGTTGAGDVTEPAQASQSHNAGWTCKLDVD
ncbi:hypothetical protein C8J57DRAFT_1493356 [Mycena rebaudengoi]|nr:hypothetical protein C8J57DRAFT_1493356 [Mycena rebaudengoi]